MVLAKIENGIVVNVIEAISLEWMQNNREGQYMTIGKAGIGWVLENGQLLPPLEIRNFEELETLDELKAWIDLQGWDGKIDKRGSVETLKEKIREYIQELEAK